MKNETIKSKAELLFSKNHQLFLNFLKNTTQNINAINYMKERITDKILPNMGGECVNYLDIGCGDGRKTHNIIDLIDKYKTINTIAIEPSLELLSIYEKAYDLKNVRLVNSNWEDYQTEEKFNLITAIHVFYYINDWESAIKKMLDKLDKGYICISVRSYDEICRFKDKFFKKINNPNQVKERNLEELYEVLDKLSINYTFDVIKSSLNVADCIIGNDVGNQIIEFLLRMPYKKIPEDIKLEIRNYLELNQTNGYLYHEDGFVWISSV